MGNNASSKASGNYNRSKKNVHWKAAEKPSPPSKPYIKTNYATNVMLAWDVPASDGGSPIIGYTIEHKRTGSNQWIKTAPRTVNNEIILNDLEPGWKYQFRVFAYNACGSSEPSDLSELVTVTFQRTVVIAPRFINELENKTVIENDKLEYIIGYEGIPAPTICWYKDGFEIFSSRRTKIITENGRSVLIIYQAALMDEGEIKCTATNKIGYATTRAFLLVEAPPKIRLQKNYQDGLLFELGETIRLKVSIAGKPKPSVSWFHNGEPITFDERVELSEIDQNSILKISHAKREDRGEYQIKALNKLDEFSAFILVSVTDRPTPPINVRVRLEGKIIVLNWDEPLDDGGCKIGNYIIEYYKTGWNVWLKAITSRNLGSELDNLIEGAEYKFRVKAENPYGISEPSESTDAIFIPDVKRGIYKYTENPNDDMLLSSNHHSKSHGDLEQDIMETPVRPKRTLKAISSPVTPEMSPRLNRKEKMAINDFFERESSATREMYYGSPNMFSRKRTFEYPDKEMLEYVENKEKQRSPSPFYSSVEPEKKPKVEYGNTTSVKTSQISNVQNYENYERSDSYRFVNEESLRPLNHYDLQEMRVEPREDVFSGSSEFMLVLLPSEKGSIEVQKSMSMHDLNEDFAPPPMSLSAPELSEEPPSPGVLRRSASSSELLHERAFMRFYNEMQSDIINKLKPPDLDTSTSLKRTDSTKLEIKTPLRRRLSGGEISTQLLRQKRLSWNKDEDNFVTELKEIISEENSQNIDNVLQTYDKNSFLKPSENVRKLLSRQRSESEEKEEEEFEQVRAKMQDQKVSKIISKPAVKVVDEELWDEESNDNDTLVDEEEVTDEELSEEYDSDTDLARLKESIVPPYRSHMDIEDAETYHPRTMNMVLTPTIPKITLNDDEEKIKYEKTKKDEPFEILRKPLPLPEPNFVPKPILKKRNNVTDTVEITKTPPAKPVRKTKESSFLKTLTGTFRGKKSSKTDLSVLNEAEGKEQAPLNGKNISSVANTSLSQDFSNGKASNNAVTNKNSEINDYTQKEHKIDLKSSPIDETNVVISHYGDILKEYSQPRRPHKTYYLSTEALKAAASDQEDEDVETDTKSNELEVSATKHSNLKIQILTEDKKPTNNETQPHQPIVENKKSFLPNFNNLASLNGGFNDNSRLKNELKSLKFDRSEMGTVNEDQIIENIPRVEKSFRKSPDKSLLHKDTRLYSSQIMVTPHNQLAHTAELYHQFEVMQKIEKLTEERKQTKQAEIKVRNIFEYVTDFAMFLLACWLYFFKDERLAIPVLVLMVYRQLSDEVKNKLNRLRLPRWLAWIRYFRKAQEQTLSIQEDEES